jgi:hypothetical protein
MHFNAGHCHLFPIFLLAGFEHGDPEPFQPLRLGCLNQSVESRLSTRRRVTTGRNGDVGRSIFPVSAAASAHGYALTTDPFPAGATRRKMS